MSNNLKGILWALAATALLSVVAAMAKFASVNFHVLQILFFRQLFVFLAVLPSVAINFPESLKTNQPALHALRLCGAFVALSMGVWALTVLPLTTATVLAFSQVFFVSLLALTFLSEPVGIHRISAVIVGFIGVIIVMRPGFDGLINVNALIPIAGAMGASIAVVSVRKLSQTESTASILAYQAIFVGAMAGIPLFWLWVTPSAFELVFLMGMGMLAAAGNWVGVKALQLGEASVIGNIEYVKLIYATIFGYFLFAEVPDAYTIAGAGIIIAVSAYIFHRESLNKR